MMHDSFFKYLLRYIKSLQQLLLWQSHIYVRSRTCVYIHNVEYIYFYTIHMDCYQNFWGYSNVINLYMYHILVEYIIKY